MFAITTVQVIFSIALGSVAATPIRVREAEVILEGLPRTLEVVDAAVDALGDAIHPIDDVRSTAAYRRMVTGRVLRLDVNADGLAVLEVQWGVLDGAGAMVLPGRVSRYEARSGGRDAGSLVAAMNATVTAFSTDVVVALR